MCEGASKQTPDLKILPSRDRPPTPTPPPPPRFEIPGSATVHPILSLIKGQFTTIPE